MLVQSPLVSRVGVVRLQGCFIHRQEITRVVGYLKEHYETHYDEKYLNLAQETEQATSEYANSPEFKEAAGNTEEERYQAIKEWVLTQEYMSISRIQRECAVGFNRAGRFFLRLQSEGIVASETEGNKGCPVLGDRLGGDTVVTSDEQTSFRSDD
jgi:DNA segregation ATPase FtsK/SpoIIIE-like protein